jgi:hypothetical protein
MFFSVTGAVDSAEGSALGPSAVGVGGSAGLMQAGADDTNIATAVVDFQFSGGGVCMQDGE